MSVFTTIDVIESTEFQSQVLKDHIQSVRAKRWFKLDPGVARRFIKHNLDPESLHPDSDPNTKEEAPIVRRSLRILVNEVTTGEIRRSTSGIVSATDTWIRTSRKCKFLTSQIKDIKPELPQQKNNRRKSVAQH